MRAELLLNVTRGNLIERQHYGYVVLIDKDKKVIYKKGDTDTKFFLRSSEKPVQAIPLLKNGVFDKFKFSLEEIAIVCASHAGTQKHIDMVRNILFKINCSENELQCGILAPLDDKKQYVLIKNDEKVTKIHNNCSGKHAGMLAACKANGFDTKNYMDYDHPHQIAINEEVKKFFEVENFELSTDGCGTPTHGIPVYNMAVGFLNFFLDKDNEIFKKAYQTHPFFVGGDFRQDTEIMRATNGKIIAKVGAEGLCLLYNTELEQSMAVKILDSSMDARAFVIVDALKKNNWITQEQVEILAQRKIFNRYISNSLKNIVGEINSFV